MPRKDDSSYRIVPESQQIFRRWVEVLELKT